MNPIEPFRLYAVREVAAYIGRSPKALSNELSAGAMRDAALRRCFDKRGGQWKARGDQLLQYINGGQR